MHIFLFFRGLLILSLSPSSLSAQGTETLAVAHIQDVSPLTTGVLGACRGFLLSDVCARLHL